MKKIYTLIVLTFFYNIVYSQCNFIQIGSDTITNSVSNYPAPYGNSYWGARHHILIHASELASQGISAGNFITIGFDVVSLFNPPLLDFKLKMGHTTVNNLTGWIPGLQTVFSVPSYSPNQGWNDHYLDSPFYWDGTSNIVIETCFNNQYFTTNSIMRHSLTSFTSVIYDAYDSTNVCSPSWPWWFNGSWRPNIRFTFGSQINIIKGKLFIDINSNGIHDTAENVLKYHNVSEINTGVTATSGFTGEYSVQLCDSGNYDVTPSPLIYYNVMPAIQNVHFSTLGQIDTLNNFAFQPAVIGSDLQIDLAQLSSFCPGFYSSYSIPYKNVGTTSIPGLVILYPDSGLSYHTSFPAPSLITGDSITWNIPVLNSFDQGYIEISFQIPSNVIAGTIINSSVLIEPVASDANPADNFYSLPVTVTSSFDPNDIIVNRNELTTDEIVNPPYLEYTIRFQNTGTDTAFTVNIENTLPQNIQLQTFEFISSSHPVQFIYNQGSQAMWFNFDNILLPDSNTNELLSHGFVKYRIKPLSTLSLGDLIENTAAIYFDFNAPVITNTAVTEVVLPISVPHIKNNHNLSLYPNPTSSELNISFNLDKVSHVNMQLYNSLGQLLKTITDEKINAGENKINLSTGNIPPGIYHLKFAVDGNVVARKVVKM